MHTTQAGSHTNANKMIPKNWEKSPMANEISDQLIASFQQGYAKGFDHGKRSQEDQEQRILQKNIPEVLEMMTVFLNSIENDLKIKVKGAHLRINSVYDFEGIIEISVSDFVDKEKSAPIFKQIRSLTKNLEDRIWNVDIKVSPTDKGLSESSLISNGFFLKYSPENGPNKAK